MCSWCCVFSFLVANFIAALTWTSNDTTCSLLARTLFPRSLKPFISGASFRMNRLMPDSSAQSVTLEVLGVVYSAQKPLPASASGSS